MNGWRSLTAAMVLVATVTLVGLAAPPASGSAPASPPASPNAADARQQAEQILQGELYQRWRLRQGRETAEGSNVVRQLLRDWREWMQRQWDRFFNRRRDAPADPMPRERSTALLDGLKVLGWIIVAGAVIFFVVVIIRTLMDRERAGAAARVLSRAQVRQAMEAGEALALESNEWLKEADALREEQDTRGMYRALYLALLSGLHSAGRIDFRTNRTNWTYVRQFRGQDADRMVFHRLTEAFDEVWYGHHVSAAPQVADVRQQVARLLTEREAGS